MINLVTATQNIQQAELLKITEKIIFHDFESDLLIVKCIPSLLRNELIENCT